MKQIKVQIIFEVVCDATPENYDGETDIDKMAEMEMAQLEDCDALFDIIMNREPKIVVTVEEKE